MSRDLNPLRRAIPVAIALSVGSATAPPVENAGSKYFDHARIDLIAGTASPQNGPSETGDAAAAADKGWAAVLAADPMSPGFLDGVYEASSVFATLGSRLHAEAVYTEAEALCGTPDLRVLKLRLDYIHADYLIGSSEYVNAEGILRASLWTENSAPQKSLLFCSLRAGTTMNPISGRVR